MSQDTPMKYDLESRLTSAKASDRAAIREIVMDLTAKLKAAEGSLDYVHSKLGSMVFDRDSPLETIWRSVKAGLAAIRSETTTLMSCPEGCGCPKCLSAAHRRPRPSKDEPPPSCKLHPLGPKPGCSNCKDVSPLRSCACLVMHAEGCPEMDRQTTPKTEPPAPLGDIEVCDGLTFYITKSGDELKFYTQDQEGGTSKNWLRRDDARDLAGKLLAWANSPTRKQLP